MEVDNLQPMDHNFHEPNLDRKDNLTGNVFGYLVSIICLHINDFEYQKLEMIYTFRFA